MIAVEMSRPWWICGMTQKFDHSRKMIEPTMDSVEPQRIFICTPITQALDRRTGLLRMRTATRISRVAEALRAENHDIFLAIDREKWGKAIMPPDQCTRLDFDGLQAADHIVAIFGDAPSEGLIMELGWASALKRRITILGDENAQYSPLVQGLATICDARIFSVNWISENSTWRTALQLRGLISV